MKPDTQINVLELRNYLLKPNTFERFRTLFDGTFVEPMNDLGGYTVGQYEMDGEPDRFVWMRAFENMQTRFDFLNAFYLGNEVWKKYKPEANGMIVNNDNVYLLRPLDFPVTKESLKAARKVVVIDLYISNGHRDETISLFRKEYLPYLKSHGVTDVSVWVSEMTENDFPRLPVFQDKNLLVTMAGYKSDTEYRRKTAEVKTPPAPLDTAMKRLITTTNRWVLRSVK